LIGGSDLEIFACWLNLHDSLAVNFQHCFCLSFDLDWYATCKSKITIFLFTDSSFAFDLKEKFMKTLSITALIVAGFLAAAGSGVIGQTGLKTDDESTCCSSRSTAAQEAPVAALAATKQGECCAASSKQQFLTSVATQEKDSATKTCEAGGSCCSKKAAGEAFLTSTPATQDKQCEGKTCEAGGACCASKTTTVATTLTTVKITDDATAGTCPVAAAMEKLPKMMYVVAKEKVSCDKMAAELAQKHSQPIHYAVAEKTFEDKASAMNALVEETESFVTAFVAPSKCEVSGNVTVAGKSCSCPVEGDARTQLVAAAIEKVSMKYAVAGKEAACSNCAAAMAKEASAPIEYVVGDQKTTCQVTARLNLARAKYQAAVQAVAASEKS